MNDAQGENVDLQSEDGNDESVASDGGDESNKDAVKKEKKIKDVGVLALSKIHGFRFASRQDRVMIIIGLLLATLHATAMPALMFVFGIALRHFADNYHTSKYFRCMDEPSMNCSVVVHCSNVDNVTDCCVYDQFDCVASNTLLYTLDFVTLYCVIITIVVFFSGWAHAAIFNFIGDQQMLEIRKRLFRSIILQDISWFDVTETAEITSKMTEKLDQLEGGLGESFSITFQTMISVLILTVLSFYYEWHTALVFLGNWPIAVTAGVFLQQMEKQQGIRKDEEDNDEVKSEDYGEAGAIAEEMLSAIHTVTSYGGQSVVVDRYGEALETFRKAQQRKLLIYGALYGVVSFGVFVYAGVTYWFGAWVVEELDAGFTDVVMAILCADAGFLGLAGNAIDMDNIGIAQKAAAVIFDIIDTVPTIDVSSDDGIVPNDDVVSYDINFNNVTFSYPSRQDTKVLIDLSLNIQNGQTIALVGSSGSGKSTIVQLLQRFYDVDCGELLIGGYNIRDLNLHWLRQHIGVVSQEPVLFATTIAENIRYGKDGVSLEEIVEAAKAANADSFITELPEGYETLVGERGTQLSGGQKQRVAIARALIRNPKILLLDEATSALDTESEAMVQAALDKASLGRTTIIIAHRLSTIQRADIVAVVEDGNIVEIGTQTELLAQQGRFYKLVMAQLYGDKHQLISNDDEVVVKKKSSDELMLPTMSQTYNMNQLQDYEEEGREMLDIIKTSRWPYLLIAMVASFVEGSLFCLVVFSFLTSGIQSFLNPTRATEDARPLFVWFAFMSVGMGTAIFSKGYFFGSNGGVLISQLRRLSLQAMLRQEIGWFDLKYNWTGALVSKLAIDASLIQNVVGNQLGIMISSSGMFVCITILTFIYLDATAASITMVTLLPLALSPVIIRSVLSLDITNIVQMSREESNHVMFEAILHIRTVTSLSLHDKLVETYEDYLTSCRRDKKRHSIILGLIYGLVEIIQFLLFAILLRFGAYLVTLPPQHIFHTSFINVFVPLLTTMYASGFSKQLGHSLSSYLKAKSAVKTIFTLLHRVPQIDVYSNRGLATHEFRGEVNFNNVTFAYPTRTEVPILTKISFSVIPGQTLAIVGSSGCGKSTVTALLERFYDPLHGTVRFDNTDIKLFNIQWLRRQIGLVSQEPILFDTSIADNIRFGANFREVTDDEVEMAARAADIHDFITSLPQGYDTKVGPKGGHLSGGQKQRVAIARALVRDPKILILDEATSALDTESEKIVEVALEKAQAGRTCIKIAHRISTVRNADKIIVINDGQVVECGTHAELMMLNGLYYRMNDISM